MTRECFIISLEHWTFYSMIRGEDKITNTIIYHDVYQIGEQSDHTAMANQNKRETFIQ